MCLQGWVVSVDRASHKELLVSEMASEDASRSDLLEVLDRIVIQEKSYRLLNGHFTKVLSGIDYVIPSSVSNRYEIRVVEATKTRLLVTAFSEKEGQTADRISIDQSFRLEMNFPFPTPRASYLTLHAYRHLRSMLGSPDGQLVREQGVFSHYFRYEIRKDSKDRPVAFAFGLRAPVAGLQLQSDSPELFEENPLSRRLASDSGLVIESLRTQ